MPLARPCLLPVEQCLYYICCQPEPTIAYFFFDRTQVWLLREPLRYTVVCPVCAGSRARLRSLPPSLCSTHLYGTDAARACTSGWRQRARSSLSSSCCLWAAWKNASSECARIVRTIRESIYASVYVMSTRGRRALPVPLKSRPSRWLSAWLV